MLCVVKWFTVSNMIVTLTNSCVVNLVVRVTLSTQCVLYKLVVNMCKHVVIVVMLYW